jgi:hypothetical protein
MAIKYINVEKVVSLVKNQLSSYFETNLVDESVLYENIKYLSSRFGLKIKNVNYDVLEVRNYKATLPYNFYKLKKAVGCFERRQVIKESDYRQPVNVYQEISHHKINHCETSICTNECDEVVRLVQSRLDQTVFEWSEFKPLQIGTSVKNLIDSNCPNLKVEAEDEISINEKEIIANFETGEVYVEYYTSLSNDDGTLLIPDNDIIIKAYRTQMIKDVFEFLIYNTTENVGQRYQLAAKEADDAFRFAMSYLKTPEYSDVKKIGDYQKRNYNKYYNI